MCIVNKPRNRIKSVRFSFHELQNSMGYTISQKKRDVSYMDWRSQTVYFRLSGIDFLNFRVFFSCIMVFLVLIPFSNLNCALGLRLQHQKRANLKNPLYFVILSQCAFSKKQDIVTKMYASRSMSFGIQ